MAGIYPDRPLQFAMAITTHGALPYIHLQLEARKRLYSDVPAIVIDDASDAPLDAICRQYGVAMLRSTHRRGHEMGDLAAFSEAIKWGAGQKCDLLVKMSRRWIPLVDWRPELESLARASQAPTFAGRERGLRVRTEFMALRPKDWVGSPLDKILQAVQCGIPCRVEGFFFRHVLPKVKRCSANKEYTKTHPGCLRYQVWPFLGSCRREKLPHRLWRASDGPEKYAAQAKAWGLNYTATDFVVTNENDGKFNSEGNPVNDQRKRFLVVLNIGEKSLSEQSRASMVAAAHRWGAKFREITQPLQAGVHPFWQKMMVHRVLSGPARVLQLDADMLVADDAPDPFVLVPPKSVGVVSPNQSHWPKSETWRNQSISEWSRRIGLPAVNQATEYLNSGFVLYSIPEHRALLDRCVEDAAKHGYFHRFLPEQAVLSMHLKADKVPTKWLPKAWNLVDLHPSRNRGTAVAAHVDGQSVAQPAQPAYVRHFTGSDKIARIAAWSAQVAQQKALAKPAEIAPSKSAEIAPAKSADSERGPAA